LNRIPKKEKTDPSMINIEGNLKEDYDFLDELLRLRKVLKDDKK